jgi:hypothetical protein
MFSKSGNAMTSYRHFLPVAEINATTYFKTPFNSLVLPKNFTEYTVMNIEPIPDKERYTFSGQGAISKKVFWFFFQITPVE